MKSKLILAVLLWSALCATANAQAGCGDTLNWTSPSCQVIGSGSLNTAYVNGVNDPNAWTVISRHGEYGQSETECNVPSAITEANGNLVITVSKPAVQPICGAWNQNGAVRNTPRSFPYATGDIQWNTFNFTYGTAIVRAKFPNQNTGVWPAIWWMPNHSSIDCQTSNKYSGDTYSSTSPTDPSSTCVDQSNSAYREIDQAEFMGSVWPQMNLWTPGQNPFAYTPSPINDGAYHTYLMSWTPGVLSFEVDGASAGHAYNSNIPSIPMFLILQIQTGGPGGTPNDSFLPTSMSVDYVKVCNNNISAAQCASVAWNDANVIFYDDFSGTASGPAAPTGLTATVK